MPKLSRGHVDNFGECAGTCWCRRDSLTCQRPDTLDSIPILSSKDERTMINNIAFATWGSLNSRRAASPLVRLVKGEDEWVAL
ncbi:hypothetical protein TNCV_4412911 [Trichonephila clavipes]|nr:hypothetical protein TNCV_4412911 [Trichonephila clavipes]